MNKTIIFFLVSMISLICLAQSINGALCTCTCCSGNSCTPTLQGSFSVGSCAGDSCFTECRSRYTACSPQGSTHALCTPGASSSTGQHKTSIILPIIFLFIFRALKLNY